MEYIGRPDGKDLVRVTVTVETESQRAIMIGRGGQALKQLSTTSRRGIEDFLGEEMRALHHSIEHWPKPLKFFPPHDLAP